MGIVAVAIDTDKGSQIALKWAIDKLITKGSTIVLIHVKVKPTPSSNSTPRARMNGIVEQCMMIPKELDEITKEIFRPYCVFCARKDIHCKGIVLEHGDVAKALIEYTSQSAIEHLVIGSSNKNGFLKRNIATEVSRGAPNFCNVYIITKGKISSLRSATAGVAPPCNPIYGEETMIGDLFSQEEEEEEETDGLLHMHFASESILPSELPKSTVNLTDEPSVYKEASAIPKMINEVSSVTCRALGASQCDIDGRDSNE
ncbi:hypothetical protein P8452_00738 [Trifolium repens]|nr:hypothetical protein P8452_00738 [Trifolium repens]